MMIDGENDDLGFDDGGLDLNFDSGDSGGELTAEDMAAGTQPIEVPAPKSTTTDLSGSKPAPTKQVPAQVVPTGTPDPNAPAAQPGAQTPPTEQPVQQQPTGQPQPGATENQRPVSVEEYVSQNHEAIVQHLASSHFKIDDKVAEGLGFPPEVKAWIEQRDARNYMLTMVQMNNALQQALPTVVANLVDLTHRTREANNGFFGEFPELNKPEFGPALTQLARTLRTVHPKMDKASFQTLVGNAAIAAFQLQRQAPQTQGQPNGGRRVTRGRPQPFAPAGSVPARTANNPTATPQLGGLDFINSALAAGLGED